MMGLGEKCGVFGIYGRELDVSRLTFFGLYALQHRGQESSGIAVANGSNIKAHKGTGLLAQVFNENNITDLKGHIAIGHNRYSTSGGSSVEQAQPLIDDNKIALAHNGNLPSTKRLEEFLKEKGVSFDSTNISDSQRILKAIAVLLKLGKSVEDAVREIFPLMTGAFSILILTPNALIAIRDSYGIRPLSVGKLDGGYVISSETCALHPIGATYMQDVQPGEMVIIDDQGLHCEQLVPSTPKLDIFEFVYFSRPDSQLLGKLVYTVRRNFGKILAEEYQPSVDVVMPVPETAIPVAIGYAKERGIAFEMGLVKNRYIHRTFIEPEQHIREQGVKMKLTPLIDIIKGKRVAIIDDSIVRGTTSQQIVRMLFEAGAREVHFLVSSPPVRFPDFYGIDTPRQEKLLAATRSVLEMEAFLGATSLYFLSYEGMIRATGVPEEHFCTSCFTGDYPINLGERTREITLTTFVTS